VIAPAMKIEPSRRREWISSKNSSPGGFEFFNTIGR
jgi:hypothetical protein